MLVRLFDRNSEIAQFNAELDKLIASLMKKYNVHTVGYALIDNFEVVRVETINEKSLLERSSLFQACSLSKTIAAYAILDLAAKNKIQLDSPANMYLSSWKIDGSPHKDTVTVRHCLNMTSGLCFGDLGTTFAGYSQNAQIPILLEILRGVPPATNSAVKVVFEPGSQYYYSGAGYMVLQQLIEDIVKQPFSEYMKNVILPTLGMKNSIFECPLSNEKRKQAISGYKQDGAQIEGGWEHIVGAASGGLWSCPEDMANFMLYVAKLYVGKNTIELSGVINEMLSRHQNTDYGLGVVVDGENDSLNFRKNGYNSGYHNEFIMFPNCGKGIVVMTNSAAGMPLINDLVVFVSERVGWPHYRSDFSEVVSMPIKK